MTRLRRQSSFRLIREEQPKKTVISINFNTFVCYNCHCFESKRDLCKHFFLFIRDNSLIFIISHRKCAAILNSVPKLFTITKQKLSVFLVPFLSLASNRWGNSLKVKIVQRLQNNTEKRAPDIFRFRGIFPNSVQINRVFKFTIC